MRTPENITKCVIFVCYLNQETQKFVPVGTAFFLGKTQDSEIANPIYIITARHILDELDRRGVDKVYLRMNLKEEFTKPLDFLETNIKSWYVLPDRSVDVAIFKQGIPRECDHLALLTTYFVDQNIFDENEVGLGDEVFVAGLFRHHASTKRNVPIVRTGNIAAFDNEKIFTEDFGAIDAFLVEARSIGGLSGSPVFLNLGFVRSIGGKVKFLQQRDPMFHILGLIHGHYDSNARLVDSAPDRDADCGEVSTSRINTGIAIVVPYYNILSAIDGYENALSIGNS